MCTAMMLDSLTSAQEPYYERHTPIFSHCVVRYKERAYTVYFQDAVAVLLRIPLWCTDLVQDVFNHYCDSEVMYSDDRWAGRPQKLNVQHFSLIRIPHRYVSHMWPYYSIICSHVVLSMPTFNLASAIHDFAGSSMLLHCSKHLCVPMD